MKQGVNMDDIEWSGFDVRTPIAASPLCPLRRLDRRRETKNESIFFRALVVALLLFAGLILLLFAALFLDPIPYVFALIDPPVEMVELRQTLEKCSCEPEIQAEVDNLLSRPREQSCSADDVDFSTRPALARFSKNLHNLSWWIEKSDLGPGLPGFEPGLPSHLRLRFGQHFHYQYILIFPTGTVFSSPMSPYAINPPYEHVTGNIYFKPGTPYGGR